MIRTTFELNGVAMSLDLTTSDQVKSLSEVCGVRLGGMKMMRAGGMKASGVRVVKARRNKQTGVIEPGVKGKPNPNLYEYGVVDVDGVFIPKHYPKVIVSVEVPLIKPQTT